MPYPDVLTRKYIKKKIGSSSPGGEGVSVYVQDTAPSSSLPYLWVETDGGSIKTMWVNVV